MECDHDGRLQRRLPAGCHIELSDVRSSYNLNNYITHRKLTELVVHTVSNPAAAGVTLHTNLTVRTLVSMVAVWMKANSPSQLEAQKQDKHSSHSLDRESGHTVSLADFCIEDKF